MENEENENRFLVNEKNAEELNLLLNVFVVFLPSALTAITTTKVRYKKFYKIKWNAIKLVMQESQILLLLPANCYCFVDQTDCLTHGSI